MPVSAKHVLYMLGKYCPETKYGPARLTYFLDLSIKMSDVKCHICSLVLWVTDFYYFSWVIKLELF